MERKYSCKQTGSVISELRIRDNESQQDLADAIGVSRSLVKSWESGERRIKIDDLLSLSSHYHVSADYLLGLSGAATDDRDEKFVCEYTGLSKETIEKFHKYAHLQNHETGILGVFDSFVVRFYEQMVVKLYLIKRSIDSGRDYLEHQEASPGKETLIYGPLRMRLYSFSEFCRRIPNSLFGSDEVFERLESLSWLPKVEEEINLDDFLDSEIEDEW